MEYKKLNLPKLKSLELNKFTLYDNGGKIIKIDLEQPISCVIGANGLGKSTLLNCINYALTGIINQTGKKIKSVNDYYINNRYSFEYFTGRISDIDREYSTVAIVFEIKDCTIRIVRNFFPTNRVIEFECSNKNFSSYEEAIIKLIGLKSFEQFAFLQTKVLTFDEDRECLFWQPAVLTPTLYLTMGLSPETAAKADELASQAQKSNSRVRNLQYEINKMNKRIQVLLDERNKNESSINSTEEISEAEMNEKYDNLLDSLNHANQNYDRTRVELEITTARISELTAKAHILRKEYDDLYTSIFSSNNVINFKNNPIITDLYKGHCNLCDSSSPDIWRYADSKISEKKCPLCNSKLDNKNSDNQDGIILKLKDIDSTIAKLNSELNEKISKSTRIRQEIESLSSYLDNVKQEIIKMESNPRFSYDRSKSNGFSDEIDRRIETMNFAIVEVEIEKEKEIKLRDSLKDEASKLHDLCNDCYIEAQKLFLPKFRTLARAFTGLDVDIKLVRESDDAKEQFAFVLALQESGRKSEQQLSESQRFFIDIALRMAIVDFIADKTNEGCILIDTPEGSLDIAYETNAGEMFSEYVKRGHQLIITANLNSSGLIRTLARGRSSQEFNLINMLIWANLSSVQTKRMELFNGALKDIELSMEKRETDAY